MKKYYTSPKQDPSSSDYDPKVLVRRPLYTENEELADLRTENFRLMKLLLENDIDPKPTKGKLEEARLARSQPKEEVQAPPPINDKALEFIHVPATAKSPSGGILSGASADKAKAKAAPKAKKGSSKKG